MIAEPRRPDPRFRGHHAPARPRWAAARGLASGADRPVEAPSIAGETRSFAPVGGADGRLSGPD